VLLKIRELDDEDESDGKMKLLNEYFAHNLPQSACADILDSILQDGNMDNDTKVRYQTIIKIINKVYFYTFLEKNFCPGSPFIMLYSILVDISN
jgi:hypothetical protein